MWAAADLGTYYKFGAISAFEVMATDPTIADAIYLLGSSSCTRPTPSPSATCSAPPAKFQKKADLLAAIEILVDYGWLQLKAVAQQTGKGRPSSPTYKIHPLAKA